MDINDLSSKAIGAAIEVHKHLGPGLLESVYQKCLAYELNDIGLDVREEVLLPIKYKNLSLEHAFRADIVINNQLVIELKAVDNINPVAVAQLLSYLKMGRYPLGLLINFNVLQLRQGIKRIINK